jgi:hypothetical protein
MATDGTPDSRPLLAGGERLGERVQLPASGGQGEPPQTFGEARARLSGMVTEARRLLAELPDELRADRVLFEATVLPNYLANSHYPGALFEEIGVVAVGARAARGVYVTPNTLDEDAPAKTFVVSGDDESMGRLADLLQSSERDLPERVRGDVVKLQDVAAEPVDRILRFGSRPVIEIDGRVATEVIINPIVRADGRPDTDQLAGVLEKWQAYVGIMGGEASLDWVRTSAGMIFLPTLIPRDQLRNAARFNPLRTLRPMPRVVVAPQGPLRAIGGVRPTPPSTGPTTTQRIALFDGTVADTVPALSPYVNREDLTGGVPDDARSVQHATTVASAAAFGNIDESQALPYPPAALDTYRVWPPPADQRTDTHMYWVLDAIVAELNRHDHRIVSLSIGPEFTVDDASEPHLWTATLDGLAASRGILFCVAAGNTGDEDPESGANRLGVPADLINGLSVGACDRSPSADWTRAPYSSVGPGRPGARVAPQIVACGGHLPDWPFGCLVPGGQLAHSHGTSLAAPTLAKSVAELAYALDSRASLNTLRAFAIHFADRNAALAETHVGYGRVPEELVERLTCRPNEATILYEDTLRRGRTVMLRVPLADQLLHDLGNRYLRFRWTLTFASPVDVTDPVDYSQAGVTAYFRPHSERFNMNLEGHSPIPVRRLDEPDFYNYLIREGRTPSDRPITRPLKDYAPETERRQDGKWETIVRIDDRMQASSLYRPTFDVHLLTRQSGRLTSADASDELGYSLLVTVAAPEDVLLYDAVRAEAPALLPVTIQPQLRVQT